MRVFDDAARVPPDAADDLEYVRREYTPLDGDARALVAGGHLPQATYVLPDGTPMVPVDHAELAEATDLDGARIRERFAQRFTAAGGEDDELDDIHAAWLTGELGACLYRTSPEAVLAKVGLMRAITALLADPRPDDADWRGALRGAVDGLDALERPFARFDRDRFGGPVSRDRLVTATRERYPELWSDPARCG